MSGNDPLGWNPTRRRSQRKKIQDTTSLSLFVQEESSDHPARVRRGNTGGAPESMGRQRCRGHSNAEAALSDMEGAKLPLAAMSFDGVPNVPNVAQLLHPPASEILDGGGLRLMRSMSVFLTQDERIILADPSSGMAALVTGVAQVSDAELATIAAAQKACLPSADAAHPAGVTNGLVEPPRAAVAVGTASEHKPAADQPEIPTVKSDAENPSEHGPNGLAGALAGLLALKSGEVSKSIDARKSAADGTASPANQPEPQGTPVTSTKRQRGSSPPPSRPKSARAAKRAASSPLKAQSPHPRSHAPVTVPQVRPVITHSVPPVIPPAGARQAIAAPLIDAAGPPAALLADGASHVLDMWQAAEPSAVKHSGAAAVSLLSDPIQADPSAGKAVGAAVAEAAEKQQHQAAACMSLPAALMTMIGAIAPSGPDAPAQLPQPLPAASLPSLQIASGSAAAGTALPLALPTHPGFSQLMQSQLASGSALPLTAALPILPIEQLCNISGPPLTTGAPLLPPRSTATANQCSADIKPLHALPTVGTACLPAAIAGPAVSIAGNATTGDHTTVLAMCPKLDAAAPLSLPETASTLGLKTERVAHQVSSINSLNCGISMDTSAREGDTSQNVTEGSLLANGSEFTSRVATSDPALFSAELRPHASVSSLPRAKTDLRPSSSLPPSSGMPVRHAQEAAGDGSGAPTPENTSGGRVSSLKQDNADNRTLQRRARNRDAARRTRLKKMLLLQGGESRVMSLADEVEARTVELKGIQHQVQEARTLNQRLRARLTTEVQVAAREATAAV